MLRFFVKPRSWRGHFSDLCIVGPGAVGMDADPDSHPVDDGSAVDASLEFPALEITIVGDPHGKDTAALADAAGSLDYGAVRVKVVDPVDAETLAELGYTAGESAMAYVCIGAVCLPPVDAPSGLENALEEFTKPSALQVDSILKRLGD